MRFRARVGATLCFLPQGRISKIPNHCFTFGNSCVKAGRDRSKCLDTAVRNLPRPRHIWPWSQSAAVKRLLCTQTFVLPSRCVITGFHDQFREENR